VSYGPTELLSRKLNSAVYLKKLQRGEMHGRLQLIRPLDDLTNWAYKTVEEKKHREQLDDSPHGDPWHVSNHASKFPGDHPLACPRAALYGLMDFAREAGDRKARNVPFDRAGRTIMAAGKAIEVELVQTYADAGILLSAKPTEKIQTGFEHSEAWLTGSVDCVVCWPDTNMAVPIEVKSKYQAVIDEMKLGKRGPDLGHVFQLKTQLALITIAMAAKKIWQDYDPPTHGYIYYLSRDRPSDTAEFKVQLDMKFFEAGIKRLKQWKQWFLEDVLPEEPKGKRTTNFGHPMGAAGFKWSQLPCQWCDYKKTCQLDFRQSITTLSESVGVDRTRAARGEYDVAKAVKEVKDRWPE
jgi:CRISPR/Cas system-associated exonuclease Cas4 (RecB family)